jgi:ribosome-associated translation inhibitor RaiA
VHDVSVVVSREGHAFFVDISLNTATHAHMVAKSRGSDSDVYRAFDMAAAKIEKQLRRYKRKLKSHDRARHENNKEAMAEYVHYVISSHDDEVPEGDSPLVVAEQNDSLHHLTVSEAVMRLDLEDLPILFFINQSHGGLNAVYRRGDGNVAWLDPEAAVKKISTKHKAA